MDLAAVVAKGQLHKLWYTMIPEPDGISDEIQRRLELREQGNMLPFTIIDKSSEKPVGMTTYMNIDAISPRLEIGSTWICPSVQKTLINTECKYLLLQHAFEELHCIAVEFRTHFVNHQSRRAIERLGAKFDGVIRSHMIMQNGTVRDTAIYSILRGEWPTVQANLQWQLEKPRI
jgi:RimJ/RimL family protein N-acetyltransferase